MSTKLKVGVSRQDITPDVGCHLYGYSPDIISEYVLDNLTLTTFAFSYGEKRAIMINVTVCSIDTFLQTELRKEISSITGVEFENILICSTHTHTGPALSQIPGWGGIDTLYVDKVLRPKMIASCIEAVGSMKFATVATASGKSKIGINRRNVRIDDTIALGQNPWGPYNPEMTVISFKGETGDIIGNIVHYGLHGTCAGGARCISRDWSGVMVDALEEKTGGFTAFFNGPEGDVGPRLSNGRTTGAGDVKYIKEIGELAAKDAIKIYDCIDEYREVSFDVFADDINIPLQPRMPYDMAKCILGFLDPNTINNHKLTYDHFKDLIDSYHNGYVEKENAKIPQTVLRIGNTVFASTPYELFSEIGMRINEAREDYHVLTLALTNGDMGYFVTKDQLARNSYESRMFKSANIQQYVDNADYHMILGTLKNIDELN